MPNVPISRDRTTTMTPGIRSGFGPGLGGYSLSWRKNRKADRIGISGPWLYSGNCQASSSALMPSEKNTPATITETSSQKTPQFRNPDSFPATVDGYADDTLITGSLNLLVFKFRRPVPQPSGTPIPWSA